MNLKQRGINLDLSHIRAVLFFALARIPMPRTWRKVFIRAAGVNLTGRKYFIARDVQFDSVYIGLELKSIGESLSESVDYSGNFKSLSHADISMD